MWARGCIRVNSLVGIAQVTTMAVNAPGPDIKSRREETDLSVYVNDLAGVDDSDDDDR